MNECIQVKELTHAVADSFAMFSNIMKILLFVIQEKNPMSAKYAGNAFVFPIALPSICGRIPTPDHMFARIATSGMYHLLLLLCCNAHHSQ